MESPGPLLRRLTALLLRGSGARFVEGDLHETFRRDLERGVSLRRARARYLANLLRSAASLGRDAALRSLGRLPGTGLSLIDLKLGVRMLVKYPGLTVVGGVAMAFAIAVGAGSFEFLRDAAFPVLPVEEGERVVRIQHVGSRDAGDVLAVSLEDYLVWREELRTVVDLGAFHGAQRNVSSEGEGPGEPMTGVATTASAFAVARIPPFLGRPLVEGDEDPAAEPVVVISHEVWRTRFASDPEVVGRVVRLGGTATTVVGVVPPGFPFPAPVDFWVPLRAVDAGGETVAAQDRSVGVFGRLAPGVSREQARAEVAALGVRTIPHGPSATIGAVPRLEPFAAPAVTMGELGAGGIMTVGSLFLMGLVGLACANVALLVFARAATREGEMVVRAALGASRGRIVRQLFAEAAVLAGVATLAGLAAASWGLRWVIGIMEAQDEGLPVWFADTLSPGTIGWSVVLGLVAAVVAGILPALKVTGADLQDGLQRAAGRGSGLRMGRLWTGIVVTQVALTVLFVPVVVWLGVDTWSLRNADLGVPAERYLVVELEMDGDGGWRTGSSRPALEARFQAAVEELSRRVETHPEGGPATVASQFPGGWHPRSRIEVEGPSELPRSARGHLPQVAHVTPDFFETLGSAAVSGRGFTAGDQEEGQQTVVVNEAFATEILGGQNAVGRRIRFPDEVPADDPSAEAPWHEVVGVAAELAMSVDPDLPYTAGVYRPLARGSAYPLRMAVRVDGAPLDFAPRLRELSAAVDPTLRVHGAMPLTGITADLLSAYDTWFRVVVVAGGLAVLLTLAGIYAVVSFTVSRRTREIGVRVALGADARGVVAVVFYHALKQVGSGVLIGGALLAVVVFAAWEGSPSLSFGRAALLVGYLALMVTVCMAACVVPARRALAVEPTEALKGDG